MAGGLTWLTLRGCHDGYGLMMVGVREGCTREGTPRTWYRTASALLGKVWPRLALRLASAYHTITAEALPPVLDVQITSI